MAYGIFLWVLSSFSLGMRIKIILFYYFIFMIGIIYIVIHYILLFVFLLICTPAFPSFLLIFALPNCLYHFQGLNIVSSWLIHTLPTKELKAIAEPTIHTELLILFCVSFISVNYGEN